jgi:hypothetical protein
VQGTVVIIPVLAGKQGTGVAELGNQGIIMKINEIVTESTDKQLPKVSQAGAVHAKRYDDLDTYYSMYRFGIALANHDAVNHAQGPARDKFTVWAYTDGDEEIIKKAEKSFGSKGTDIVKGPSEENDTINITSPIAKPKRNKYGV